jgi:hypothetical protein
MTRIAAILFAAGLLAGCAGDPLQDVPRLSDADIADRELQASIQSEPEDSTLSAEPQRGGFFSRMFRGGASQAPAEEASDVSDDEAQAGGSEVASADAAETEQATPRRGLLGFLSRAAEEAKTENPGNDTSTEVAAIPPQTQSDASRGGLFGGSRSDTGPKPGDPDYQIVPLGTVLPFGTLARVCNVRDRQLGTRIERYPENRNTFAIYDSQPDNTAPHTFYVTGFDDGCARQFTAALAMFGSAKTHEQLRYGLPSKVQPYSKTDAAYEKLKSRICRVGRGKPCGSAMSRLARDTVFVSVYERFGSNPVWKTILLHDGKVVATDIRSN